MKKLFTLFFALVASVGTLFASDTHVNGIWYDFDTSTKNASVTYRGSSYSSYSNGYSGNVVIPSSVIYNAETYSVTSIGNDAFHGCTGLTSVTIPNSVTSIGNYAFQNCSSLTSIEIPNRVTSIGKSAFGGCSGLTSVMIPNSVTSIGDNAFSGCSGLTSVTIPNSVTNIGNYAFQNCSSLTSIEIPNSVTSIGDFAFGWCTGLTSVTIPNSVISIGKEAFRDCRALNTVEIPNSVTSIGERAFLECTGLTSIEIPNSVTSIGEWAFYYCTGLTSVTIGNSVTSIGLSAFSGCSGLTSVTIPNSVTSIGSSAFEYCRGLTSVTIGNSVTSIGSWAFNECSGLTKVNITDIAAWCNIAFSSIGSNPLYYAKHLYVNDVEVTDLVIPNSVTSIRKYAFYNCSGLTSVTIPNSVTSIGNWAFFSCRGLTSVTIGNSVTSIGAAAFFDCPSLTDIYATCGDLERVKQLFNNNSRVKYASLKYSITCNVNIEGAGSVQIPENECEDAITAIPNEGYHFTQWNDGNTDNPRTIVLTKDTTLTAEFAINTYIVQFFGFNSILIDSQSVDHGANAVAPEAPQVEHYDFVGWDKDFSNVQSNLDVYAQYVKNTEAIDNIETTSIPCKVIENGQILILRGDKTYTLTGTEVK